MKLNDYKILVEPEKVESVWEFGWTHDIPFHFDRLFVKTGLYGFNTRMTEEDFIVFKLAIPSYEY